MSIYRDDVYRDVHTIRPQIPRSDLQRFDVEQEGHRHLRKAGPANTPLPRTLAWFASLPSEVQPSALLRQYPRITNLIAATWGDSKAFDSYMESLLTDKRGNRRGFPRDVLRELGALALQHTQNNLKRTR